MTIDSLSQLAIKYGSDKWSAKHSYTRFYYDTFAARRESVRKVVEIGVGEGASLRMWREFFPNAQIFGADNDRDRLFREERIQVFLTDQTYSSQLNMLLTLTGTDIDLFVDDGAHLTIDQAMTCLQVMPCLDSGTIYVIEDVSRHDLLDGLFRENQFDKHFVWFAPNLERRRRYDNRLLVVRHRG